MDIGSELFSMAFALKLQRVAHPTAEASSLRLSDASTADNNFFLGSDNIKVIYLQFVQIFVYLLWLADSCTLFCFATGNVFAFFACSVMWKRKIINRPKSLILLHVYLIQGFAYFSFAYSVDSECIYEKKLRRKKKEIWVKGKMFIWWHCIFYNIFDRIRDRFADINWICFI